uniref:Endoplasmic reticulum junction formation protein lunapark n=1 Tax=Phallusia mammillata TaxID=59560 RepID=A0A6F9DJU2_9ASCI|nr:protein lunapark-B [Phallusia mammillata]
MGNLLTRWRKSKTTVEVLEQIDKDIERLEKFKRLNNATKKRIITSLLIYSLVLYIVAFICLYLFYIPEMTFINVVGFQIAPTLCLSVLLYALIRLLHWWFVRKIVKNDSELQELRDQRKEILENVMETETYKKAKEILEKFDPETKKKLEEERARRESPQPAPSPGTELRRRNQPMSPPQMMPPGTPRSPNQSVGPTPVSMQRGFNGMIRGPRPPVVLPRPLLDQNPTAMDKVLEYLMGDGLNNRYALICKNCYSHNGMALKEEFEYMEYRCGYCRFYNPPRKQRPNAPVLPSRIQQITQDDKTLMLKPLERDSGNDDSPTSSKTSETEHADVPPVVASQEDTEQHRKQLDFDSENDGTSQVEENAAEDVDETVEEKMDVEPEEPVSNGLHEMQESSDL